MKQKCTNNSLQTQNQSAQTLQTQDRLQHDFFGKQQALSKLQSNQRAIKICRICLQSQTVDKNLYKNIQLFKQIEANPIIQLPCACRNQLGMIHDKCIKFWIKMWLEAKINEFNGTGAQALFYSPVIQELVKQNKKQYSKNVKNSKRRIKIRQLSLRNLKQDSIYPFPCQICHQQILFDLNFHLRLKTYAQLTKKDIILFILPLIFMISFLCICINWFMQSGVNLYSILFFTLVWIPIFSICAAVGVWTFTKKQFWVQGIYDRKDALNKQEIKTIYLKNFKMIKQANKNNQKKRQNFKFLKRQFENLRDKILRRNTKQKSLKKEPELNIAPHPVQDGKVEFQNFPNQQKVSNIKQKNQLAEKKDEIQQEIQISSFYSDEDNKNQKQKQQK